MWLMKFQENPENGSLDTDENEIFFPSKVPFIFDQSRQSCTVCGACFESETCDVAVKFIQWKPIYSRKDTSFSMTYLLTDCYQTKLFLAHVWKSQCKTLQDMPSKGDRDTVRVTLLISKLPLAVDRLRPNLQFLYRMRGNFDVWIFRKIEAETQPRTNFVPPK